MSYGGDPNVVARLFLVWRASRNGITPRLRDETRKDSLKDGGATRKVATPSFTR
jgi:hypothetical protein